MGKYTNGMYGLTEDGLWAQRDIANSLRAAYKKLQENLNSYLEDVDKIEKEMNDLKSTFKEGYKSNSGTTESQISGNIADGIVNISMIKTSIENSKEMAATRHQFYADLTSNISTAVSSVGSRYSTINMSSASEINETLEKKAAVRYNIIGSQVEVNYPSGTVGQLNV